MLFTNLGKGLAYFGLLFGVLYLVYVGWSFVGVYTAIELDGTVRRPPERMVETMNQGFMVIIGSIVLGVLCEISSSLRARSEGEN